jgi:hypothetical protein
MSDAVDCSNNSVSMAIGVVAKLQNAKFPRLLCTKSSESGFPHSRTYLKLFDSRDAFIVPDTCSCAMAHAELRFR